MNTQKRRVTAVVIGVLLVATVGAALASTNVRNMLTNQGDDAPGAASQTDPQAGSHAPSARQDGGDKNNDARFKALCAQPPQAAAEADRETVEVMHAAAQTRRPEVARLLVRCLAFNLSPDAVDESLSLAERIPAVGLLREFYGEAAAAPLYEEGSAADRKWYRDRIALAARTILSPEKIEEMNGRTLASASSPHAQEFTAAVASGNFDVKLAGRDDDKMKKISEAADRARARAAERNKQK
jgi:hypothetical protein